MTGNYNHHYQSYCYLPLLILKRDLARLAGRLPSTGKRPPGAENAMILVRLLAYLRRHWPATHILVRGDDHFATPEVLAVIAHHWHMDCVRARGQSVLLRQAAPVMQEARRLFQQRTAMAHAYGAPPPPSTRVYEEFAYARPRGSSRGASSSRRKSWPRGDNPRFVVTSLEAPLPQHVYEDLYCARSR